MSRIIVVLLFVFSLMFTGCRTEMSGHHHRAHRTEYRAGRPGTTHHRYNHAHPDVPHNEKAK